MSDSNIQEQVMTVRVPNPTDDKSFHIMKYNASMKMDLSSWSQVRMVRENNQKYINTFQTEETPKFGAGSAFGKDAKEEARRKKLGIVSRKYRSEAQPWLLKVGGKTGKKYRGVREGGITANTTYYVFTHGNDGVVSAYPISEWYNFTPIMRYKTLDVDEAEEKFAQRGKILNKWSVMVNKKVKTGGEEGEAEEQEEQIGKKGKGGGGKKDFKVSDMDDWDEDDDAFASSDDDDEKKKKDESEDEDGNKKRSKDTKKKGKKKKDSDNEAFEDSDDGDDEGREVDYMSDESSDSEDEMLEEHNIKGVDQDEGLSKMLDSDSSSDEENKDKKDENEDKDDKKKEDGEEGANASAKKKKSKSGSKNSSRAATPTEEAVQDKGDKAEKRKAIVANIIDGNPEPASKKSRLEQFASNSNQGGAAPESNSDVLNEETVRRYLKRKQMTTTDLVKKFRNKKTGINNQQLVPLLSSILKKINPDKQKVKGVTYLSLK